MTKKIVLLLQGGGALGAFQCGAWKALAPFIRANEHELIAVVGASIGAINAGLIARHYHQPDGGGSVLEDFWCKKVATSPAPFFSLPGEYWRAWNGLLTGLLLGNRALFHPAYQHWNPIGDLFRFQMPIYRTDNTEQTLADAFGEYRGDAPLLAVGTTDVSNGEAVLFDSARRTITPKMLAASIAIPLLFSPVEIDGRIYWDGEMRSNTLLPNAFALLREIRPHTDTPEDFLVIVVDMLSPDTAQTPTSTMQSQYHFLNILLGAKLKYDEQAFDVGNAYLDALERIRTVAGDDDHSPLSIAIDEEYRKAVALQRGHVEFLHIGREHFAYEHISRDFDYSPRYIARLIAQGFENASSAVENYQHRRRIDKASASETFNPALRKLDVAGAPYSQSH